MLLGGWHATSQKPVVRPTDLLLYVPLRIFPKVLHKVRHLSDMYFSPPLHEAVQQELIQDGKLGKITALIHSVRIEETMKKVFPEANKVILRSIACKGYACTIQTDFSPFSVQILKW